MGKQKHDIGHQKKKKNALLLQALKWDKNYRKLSAESGNRVTNSTDNQARIR